LAAVVEVVVLGVGSILDSEVSRCQMGLALVMKERFSCIGKILVHDLVLSANLSEFLGYASNVSEILFRKTYNTTLSCRVVRNIVPENI
jgi:hypothetical protein